jgi:hypothetical protein
MLKIGVVYLLCLLLLDEDEDVSLGTSLLEELLTLVLFSSVLILSLSGDLSRLSDLCLSLDEDFRSLSLSLDEEE